MPLILKPIVGQPAEICGLSEKPTQAQQFITHIKNYVVPRADIRKDTFFHNLRVYRDDVGFFMEQQLNKNSHLFISIRGSIENSLNTASQEVRIGHTYTIPDKDDPQLKCTTPTIVDLRSKYELLSRAVNLYQEVIITPSAKGQRVLQESMPELKQYARSGKPFSLRVGNEQGEIIWYIEQPDTEVKLASRIDPADVETLRDRLASAGIALPHITFADNKIIAQNVDGVTHTIDHTFPSEKEIAERIEAHQPIFKMEFGDQLAE